MHPRTFGNFARVYSRDVRDEKLLTTQEAIRKTTRLPISNLGIDRRRLRKAGYFATFEKPRQLTTGVSEVFVNGVEVIHKGEHTGAKPGQVVKRARR